MRWISPWSRMRRLSSSGGCRLFRRGVPLHGRLAGKIWQDALFRHADQRVGHCRHRHRHGGLRPEALYRDPVCRLCLSAYDQIVSEAARLRYRSAGGFTCPLVIRMPSGGGIWGGQTHSQSPEALFTHVTGLKTVMPSNPADAKGLLLAAIDDSRSGDLPGAQTPL